MASTKKLKEIISTLTDQIGLVNLYIHESEELKKKDTSFIICDLDYTLFSRDEQIEWEPMLKEKRGYEGNTYMINHIGINNMVAKYYEWKKYPQDIIKKLSPESSLILTAGIPEYQHKKRRSMNIEHIPMKVVWEWKDKVLETIRYVLFELKYIPAEIIVYEDRPQFFVEYKELIEWALWTKLTIMYVEMDGNEGYKKIEELGS